MQCTSAFLNAKNKLQGNKVGTVSLGSVIFRDMLILAQHWGFFRTEENFSTLFAYTNSAARYGICLKLESLAICHEEQLVIIGCDLGFSARLF